MMGRSNWDPRSGHDDMTDDIPNAAPPTLVRALTACNTIIADTYKTSNARAISHQRVHRTMALVAAIAGTIAVLLAIFQLYQPLPLAWPMVVETLAAASATCAVVAGMVWAYQTRWLLFRHKAERCRLVKFRSLIDASYWCGDEAAWRTHLNDAIVTITALAPRDMLVWCRDETVVRRRTTPAPCSLDPETVRALVSYYRTHRLKVQIEYFTDRAERNEGFDRWTRTLPHILFFCSITAVFAHFLIDAWPLEEDGLHTLSITFILLAASFPVIGAGVRTFRFSFEFARSASLFRAKQRALERLDRQLAAEADQVRPESSEILNILAQCEDFLEAEHREWLRLMIETEWFL